MDLVFLEANLKDKEELLSEFSSFVLKPKVELKKNGNLKIETFVHCEEGHIEPIEPYKGEKIITYIGRGNGKIVAYCFAVKKKDMTIQLAYLSVRKGFQKKGIGTKFIQFMNKDFEKKKIRLVNLISHGRAMDFYQKKTNYKLRNPKTKRPKSFWNPCGKNAVVFGWKPKRK
jgi:predicted GNAT family acetyltransferase